MCGRFTLTVSGRVLAELFDVEVPELVPRYNIAPTQPVLVVRKTPDRLREAVTVRWGLIPSWAEDPSIGNRMINARAETVADKPAFRSAVKARRCLIAADGFYEWCKTDGGKQPHLIRFSDRRPFAFAGLWERWTGSNGGTVDSTTIITTRPNDVVARLHDRMPVILPPDRFEEWLGPASLPRPRLEELLAPHAAPGMEAFAVSRRVNSPANDDPQCTVPLH